MKEQKIKLSQEIKNLYWKGTQCERFYRGADFEKFLGGGGRMAIAIIYRHIYVSVYVYICIVFDK